MIDRAGRQLLGAREKSPRKLVTLGNEPIQTVPNKITSIINSPRNNELKYADSMGTRYRSHEDAQAIHKSSSTATIKSINTVAQPNCATNAASGVEKENENLKKIRE